MKHNASNVQVFMFIICLRFIQIKNDITIEYHLRANHFAHSFCTEILMIYLWSLVTCCNRELYLKIQKKPKVCNLFHLIWVLKNSLDYFWMITLEYY